MEMTNGEICRDYKYAKNRQKQIKILADRNLCSIDEIRQILIDGGVLIPKPRKSTKATPDSVGVISYSVDGTQYSVVVTPEQSAPADWRDALKLLTEHITELKLQRDFAEQELGDISKALGELYGKMERM